MGFSYYMLEKEIENEISWSNDFMSFRKKTVILSVEKLNLRAENKWSKYFKQSVISWIK